MDPLLQYARQEGDVPQGAGATRRWQGVIGLKD